MVNNITVAHEVNGLETVVPVSYKIEMDGCIQTITCRVDASAFHVPAWLQLRSFVFRSSLANGRYTQLFSEYDDVKNIDTIMFIDKVYNGVMRLEKMALATL